MDYPKGAVKFFAKPESKDIEQCKRILPVRQETLQERFGERFREMDTPLLAEWPDGQREAIVFLFEEESVTSRFSIRRLVCYCADLSELLETDRIIPVTIFLHSGNYPLELKLGTEDHTFLNFNYIVCDLHQIPAEEHQNSDNIVARLNLPLMRYNEEDKVAVYASAVEGLVTLEPRIEKQLKYIDYIDGYANLTEQQAEMYKAQYIECSEQKDKIMGLFQQSRNEGRQEGLQQGMQQGEATVLLRQMQRKFGTPATDIRSKIESADSETLLHWLDNILTAEKPDDVFH